MQSMKKESISKVRMIELTQAVALAGSLWVSAQESTRYTSKSGSKVTIEGTSTIHDWTVETSLIGGYMELGPGFPLDTSKPAAPGKVDANVETKIFVSSIKSGKKSMDEVMHDTMKQKDNPMIAFKLQSLSLKESPKAGQPLLFDSVGTLTVAGMTTTNAFPITMEPQEGGAKILVKGTATLKMTDFGMKTPAPAIGLGLIKTGDEVKVAFEWVTGKAK
jgi:polyisoprenoid-binding protein YceI